MGSPGVKQAFIPYDYHQIQARLPKIV